MKKRIFLIFTAILLIPTSVRAATTQFQKCFGDDGLYSVVYDDSINTEVSESAVTLQDIKNGHLPYPSGSEDVRYNFTALKLSNKCSGQTGTILNCPTSSELQYDEIVGKYKNKDGVTSNIKFTLNENTLKFDVSIKDVTSNQVYLRHAPKGDENQYGALKSAYNNNILDRDSNGYYHIYGLEPGELIQIELYQKKADDCQDTFIGYFAFGTPSIEDVELTNPAKTNPSAYGCDIVRSYVPSGMTNTDDLSKLEGLKKEMISECYSDKISYAARTNLAESIRTKFSALKELMVGYSSKTASPNSTCNNTYSTTRLTYASSGRYWAIACTETYTAKGDIPKLVKAGAGFEYQAYYTVSRSCNITQISRPSKKPQCSCHSESHCVYDFGNGPKDRPYHAGPTEDFDDCIYKCDNGKYSQACINKCNNEVYSNRKVDQSKYQFSAYATGIGKTENVVASGATASTQDMVPGSRCKACTEYGNDGTRYHAQACDRSYDFVVSDKCANAGFGCTITSYVGPAGCSWNPESEYQSELAASYSELSSMASYQASSIPLGNYTYQITDTYLTNGVSNYVFKVDSTTNPQVKVTGGNQAFSNTSSASAPLGNSGGGTASYNPTSTRSVSVTVSLPLSYVNKITGRAAYSTTGGSNDTFQIAYTEGGYAKAKLQQVTGFKAINYYHSDGERKYYTDVHSKDTNVVYENGKPKLSLQTPYNIVVTSNNVGGGNFSSTIDCYYGVYNEYYSYDCDTHCDPKKEICDCGLQYIFRPIVLEDVFPNGREPRYNWSSKAIQEANKSLYGIKVDPVALTKEIERKGKTIYNSGSGETDYIFILTADNIKAIKNYNSNVKDFNEDKDRNYLDYDLTCYKNAEGREICTSNFLDNTTYVKYGSGYSAEQRKSIAGCNNAKDNGTRCDTSIK